MAEGQAQGRDDALKLAKLAATDQLPLVHIPKQAVRLAELVVATLDDPHRAAPRMAGFIPSKRPPHRVRGGSAAAPAATPQACTRRAGAARVSGYETT